MTAKAETNSENREVSLEAWLAEIESNWQNLPEYQVDTEKLSHLAVVCDGNRRAAVERGLDPWDGHRAGVEVIKGISQAGRQWGIQTMTFWVWSTENWQREKEQISGVMGLAAKYLTDPRLLEEFQKEGVRFVHLGRKDRLPAEVLAAIQMMEKETVENGPYTLNLAMDYGGLDETARAIGRIIKAIEQGTLETDLLENPQAILGFLDTANQVLPQLVIRTGVKEDEIPHTSGFMPLQTTYSGWVFRPELFPNLTPQILLAPIRDFVEYERRMGK